MAEIDREFDILLVDDEAIIRQLCQELLAGPGRTLREATTVAEAIVALETQPALIILDKNLPDGTGLEVLAATQARWPTTEVLMLTGFPSMDSAVEALRLGARDYITKPLHDVKELVIRVDRALAHHALVVERAETLRELERAKEVQQLAAHTQAMAQLGKLFASVMHEVRSPLSVLLGNIELCQLVLDPGEPGSYPERCEKVQRYLGAMELAAERLREMSTDVRQVSRFDQHGDLAPVSLKEVMGTVELLVRGETKARATLEIEVPSAPRVLAVPGRLVQVLVNLIVNAAQAMPTMGVIRVSTRATPEVMQLEVRDDGAGMPPEVLESIFDPFFTTKAADEGTGLGLSLAKEFIEGMDGKITVTSEVGVGTTFTLELNIAR